MKKLNSFQMIRLLFVALSLVVLAALAVGYFAYDRDISQTVNSAAVAPDFVPEYDLVNQDGQPVTQNTYAGQYQIVYFGFTSCPDVCPVELQKITVALEALPEADQDKIVPIFITVDPERDTPDVIKTYLSSFYPGFVGFTGNEEAIDHAMEGFKVYASRVEDEQFSGYMMNHSSYIYFIAPNGDLLKLFTSEEKPEQITSSINEAISSRDEN